MVHSKNYQQFQGVGGLLTKMKGLSQGLGGFLMRRETQARCPTSPYQGLHRAYDNLSNPVHPVKPCPSYPDVG